MIYIDGSKNYKSMIALVVYISYIGIYYTINAKFLQKNRNTHQISCII